MNVEHGAAADLSPLSGFGPELAAAFVALASDIALVIDDAGVVRNVAIGGAGPATEGWVGRPWAETVTGDTRRKVEQLLQEAGSAGAARRREVNHPSPGAPDIPIAYAAVRLGAGGPVLAVGRDLRAVAAIQQRFVDAQKDIEREYWRLRQTQSQQRLLDQVARDAVLVVDARSLETLKSNRAAVALFGAAELPLPASVVDLLTVARSTGRPAELRLRLDSGISVELSATPFRGTDAEHSQRLLVRARAAAPADAADDAVVLVTDSAGRVQMASAGFTALAGGDGGFVGRTLVELLGDPQRALAALLADVRREGVAEADDLSVGVPGGLRQRLQVSATLIAEGDQEGIGLTLRRRPSTAEPGEGGATEFGVLAQALDQLLGRIGELSLDEWVRHATGLAELHAIGIALGRAGGVGPAAALLGLAEADLRARMHRLGL